MKKLVTTLLLQGIGQGIGKMGMGMKRKLSVVRKKQLISMRYLSLAALILPVFAEALTCTALTGVRNWSLASTWTSAGNCNRVPAAGDLVIIPSGAIITINVNTNNLASIQVDSGGELYGDGSATVKNVQINASGGGDLIVDGILDFSGAAGAVGSKSALLSNTANQTFDISGTGTIKFSQINWNSRGAILTGITQIEFAGNATPMLNTAGAGRPITGALTANWVFSGSVAQTLTATDVATFTTWTTGTANFVVSNTAAAGLTIPAFTISGDLTLPASGVMRITGNSTISGNDITVGAGANLILAGTTTAMPTSTNKSFDVASTVTFSGSGAQVIPSGLIYGNLATATGGIKTPAAGTVVVAGNLAIGVGTTWAGNTNNPAVDIAGNVTQSGTFTAGTGMYTFEGTTTQTISAGVTIANVTVTNTSASGLSLAAAHTFTNLTLGPAAVLSIAGTTTAFPTNTTFTADATSTVRYVGSGNQTIAIKNYGNLVTGTGGIKTPAAGTLNVAGDLTVGALTTWAGNTNNPTVNIAGNFTNAGTFTSGTGIYTFNGTTAQTLTGATTFARLTMNNTAATPNEILSLNNDLTVSTTLTFTSGNIVTNANKVIIPSGAAISGAAAGTGWVAGNLQKFVAAGGSTVTFEVGTNGAASPALAYSPASFTFTGVGGAGGSFIVSSTQGAHPQISSSGLNTTKLVNRWWSSTTTGVTGTALPAFTNYSVTLNFLTGDLDAGVDTAKLFINRYVAAWTAPTMGTRAANSTQATGLTALGQFAIGEAEPVSVTKVSVVISDPINNTSNPKRIPGAIIEYTVTVTAPSTFIAGYTNVSVTDTLQSDVTYNAGTLIVNGASEDDDATNGGTSNPDVGNYNSGTRLFTINLGSMTAGSSESFKFRVTVN